MRECRGLLPLAGVLLVLFGPGRSAAGGPAPRLQAAVDDLRRSTLAGTRPPLARAEADRGRLAGAARLEAVTVVLAPTAAQEAELRSLIAELHDPASPRYHRWLAPEAFAARFGLADEDLAAVAAWLEGHGLRVEAISRGRERLRCSGKVADVEAAFGTELHAYEVEGETRFAPATDVTVPAALAPLVRAVTGLSSFRPRPHLRPGPLFTSSVSGNHFLAPGDVDVLYDVGPLRAGGADGTGISIAVVGQSEVSDSDIESFQRAAGWTAVKDPVHVLVPGSGTPTHVSTDEAESDLDLEWSGAMAPGAEIQFVYASGDPASSASVWDAIQYAVEQDLAPIVSVSYGICEPALSAAEYASLEALLARAAAQGQSVVVAAGDAGSVDCLGTSGVPPATQQALAVDYPASSEYVTAVGGTELTAEATTAAQYWTPATSGDVLTSLLSYAPEQVWNDGTGAAGGGGVSVRTPRPAWQAGVPGLPAGFHRLVPDLSLDASNHEAPYLFCSTSARPASCSAGYRDGSSNGYLTTGGGTSFGAPILAGMLALAEQHMNAGRLGVVAPALYRLASDGATYAAAFHDITAGGNRCAPGTGCSAAGAASYAATLGYDPASGLGSIDLAALVSAWASGAMPSPGFTVSASDASVIAGSAGSAGLTVVPVGGWSGKVAWTVTSTPALGAGCLAVPSTTVASGAPATATLTIHAQSSACAPAVAAMGRLGGGAGSRGGPAGGGLPLALAVALGIAAGGAGLRRGARGGARRLGQAALLAAAVALPACGGGGGSGGGMARAATGVYEVHVVGADASNPAVTASTTFTLTVR